ncbi:MAG: Pho85/PhoA-like cyclin-dependent kinase pef1 [Marteilia pararefringens]
MGKMTTGLAAAALTGGGMYMYMKNQQKHKKKESKKKNSGSGKNKFRIPSGNMHYGSIDSSKIVPATAPNSSQQQYQQINPQIEDIKSLESQLLIQNPSITPATQAHPTNIYCENHPESLVGFVLGQKSTIRNEGQRKQQSNIKLTMIMVLQAQRDECILFNKSLEECKHKNQVDHQTFNNILQKICNLQMELSEGFLTRLFSQNSGKNCEIITCRQANILFKCLESKIHLFQLADRDFSLTIDSLELSRCFNSLEYDIGKIFFEEYCNLRGNGGVLELEQFIEFSIELDTFTGAFRAFDSKAIGRVAMNYEDIFYILNLI